MVKIKCVNPQCPKKTFELDETEHIQPGGSIAQPHEEGAVRLIAVCPHCSTENTVWVKKANKPDDVTREES